MIPTALRALTCPTIPWDTYEPSQRNMTTFLRDKLTAYMSGFQGIVESQAPDVGMGTYALYAGYFAYFLYFCRRCRLNFEVSWVKQVIYKL